MAGESGGGRTAVRTAILSGIGRAEKLLVGRPMACALPVTAQLSSGSSALSLGSWSRPRHIADTKTRMCSFPMFPSGGCPTCQPNNTSQRGK